ncbi:uncharacterized protein LOC141635407 [Silene latifolia]|uniref:uncharacterized protein LOC141635407 n=1 Tax=Silene latifolia TaxID=37657 RepID=UPI003D76EB0A
MWLKFTLDKQAKEMYLFDVDPYFSERSNFPTFTSQSLVTLELHDCIIYRRFKVNLGSLKKLILCRTRMHEDTFQQYIRGCPSLQELHFMEPQIMKLRFSAPNIHRIPIVIDVSSIQDVYLKKLYVDAGDKNDLRMFNIFLEKISRCEAFRLSPNASEAWKHQLHLVDLPKLKIVTFHGYAKTWRHQLHLVEMFLKSATMLEKLVFFPNKPQLTVTEKLEFVMHVSSFQRFLQVLWLRLASSQKGLNISKDVQSRNEVFLLIRNCKDALNVDAIPLQELRIEYPYGIKKPS